MDGPEILARFLSRPNVPDKFGNVWQYHSRSDQHSKVASWGVAFDLLATSSLMKRHALDGKIILGVNHEMVDFQTRRKKKLDLVVARPLSPGSVGGTSLRGLVRDYMIPLSTAQEVALGNLPDVPVAPVGSVLVALESKATMTAHVAAKPRLYDELNSSHLAAHGASNQALAIGFVQINASPEFVSSDRNKHPLATTQAIVTSHTQPHAFREVLLKVEELPRRTNVTGVGFDGVGVVVLDFDNRGGPVRIVTSAPAPQSGDPLHYDSMIVRMAQEYDSRFHAI